MEELLLDIAFADLCRTGENGARENGQNLAVNHRFRRGLGRFAENPRCAPTS